MYRKVAHVKGVLRKSQWMDRPPISHGLDGRTTEQIDEDMFLPCNLMGFGDKGSWIHPGLFPSCDQSNI